MKKKNYRDKITVNSNLNVRNLDFGQRYFMFKFLNLICTYTHPSACKCQEFLLSAFNLIFENMLETLQNKF